MVDSGRPPPHSSRSARRVVVALLATAGILAIAAWVAAPRLLEAWASSRIERAVGRLPGRVTFGRVDLRGAGTLEVSEFAWEAGTDWEVRAGPVTVGIDWLAVVLGGSPVREARLQGLEVRLGDPAHPFAGPAEAWARLRDLVRGRARSSGGRGARPWPLLNAEGITMAVHVAGGQSATLAGGTARLGPPEGSLDAAEMRVVFEGDLRLQDGVPRVLKAEGAWSPSSGWREADVTVSPALSWDGSRGRARASGVRIRPGEVVVVAPSWAPGGPFAVEAEEVVLRMEAAPAATRPPGRPASLSDGAQRPPWLSGTVAGLLGDRRPTEVEVARPVVVFEVPVPAATGTTPDNGPPLPPRQEGAFREGLVTRFRDLDQAIARIANVASSLAESLPVDAVRVHGATVRYRRDGRPLPESLAHLDASLTRDPATGALSGRVTFECPEAAFGTNEAVVSFRPDRRSGVLSVRARRLPLGPYAGLAPGWFRVSPDTALADAEFEVRLEPGASRVAVEGTLSLERAGLFLPAVAAVPMRDLALGVRGHLVVDRSEASVRVERGLLSFGHVRVPFDLSAERLTSWPRVRLSARVERIRAQDLVESVPDDVIPALQGVRLAGSFAASAEMDVDTRDMAGLRFDFRPDVADLTILDPGQGVNLDLLRTEFYHRIDEGGGKVIERVVGPSSPSWVPLEEVPRFVVDALTTSEDSQFFRHHGFSLGGIRRSLRVNLERGGFYQGASTLSQQLAKNLFLSPEKTLARKLQEAFITWQLERFLSKEKILELYLNVVEWGPEVFGLREAALHYFGKTSAEVNPLEAAYLVSILPNPRMFHRHFEAGAVPPAFDRRVRDLLREMVRRGLLSEDEFARLEGWRIRFARPEAPGPAPDDERPAPVPDEEFSDDG